MPSRAWFGKSGLTSTEKDLFNTIFSLYEENGHLQENIAIYQKFVTTLCEQLLQHIEEDGYCRMIVKEEEVKGLLASLPELPKQLYEE